MGADTGLRYYAPPLPMRQVFSPWVRDELGNLSREVWAEEIETTTPRDAFIKLRIRLANSETLSALQSVEAAARILAKRVDGDLRMDVVALVERIAAKITRVVP
jgi:hypothetical protein